MTTGPRETTLVPPAGVRAAAAYAPAVVWLSVLGFGFFAQAMFVTAVTLTMSIAVVLVTLVQLGLAAIFFMLLGQSTRRRFLAWSVVSFALFAAPFLVPADGRALRFVTACATVIVVMKLWDLHVHTSYGESITARRFAAHLVNVFSLVLRRGHDRVTPSKAQIVRDFVRQAIGSVAGALAIASLFVVPWSHYPLAVEHAVKAPVVFLAILAFIGLTVSIVRLCGGTIRDFSCAPLLARTPSEFWRRYNLVFHQYFFENVFKPVGGRRRPALAVMLIFVVSAVIHEYCFGIAIGRVQWFQTTFFLLQGVAVALTMRVRPTGHVMAILGRSATILYNLATSFFFFLSFHAVVRLYENPLPAWATR